MFELIAGDLEPDMPLTVTLDGVAQDLTAATAITFHWVKPDGTVVEQPLTSVNLLTGQVKKVWSAGDTDIIGYHKARIIVTWPTNDPQTFPNDSGWIWWAVFAA